MKNDIFYAKKRMIYKHIVIHSLFRRGMVVFLGGGFFACEQFQEVTKARRTKKKVWLCRFFSDNIVPNRARPAVSPLLKPNKQCRDK